METDVVIVGGGPSGMMVANELALGGATVVVLERRTDLVVSRGASILPRVLELLDARGLAQTFIERAATISDHPLVPYHKWAGLEPVDWSHLDSRFGYRLILPQANTEELLETHAVKQGVYVLRGAKVSTVEQDDGGVVVRAELPDGTQQTIRGQYVVGADGARSTVRQAVGIGFDGHDSTFTGVVADAVFKYPWAESLRTTDNDMGWATVLPFDTGGQLTRFTYVHAERRSASRSEPVTAAEVRKCISDIFGEPELEFTELRSSSRYTDEMRIATSFRDRRVLLVGESTRVHYPASGAGMNFCLQDAFNLGWKLAMVISGRADATILDTYETERRPVTEAWLHSVAAQCAIQFNFSPDGIAFKRMFNDCYMPLPDVNRRIGLELNGLTFPYPSPHGSHPMTGHRVPDVDLQTSLGRTRIGELLRTQQFVLVDCTGGNTLAALGDRSPALRVVSGMPAPCPAPLRAVTSMLIRPDAYVAWADTQPPDPVRAEQVIGAWLS